MKITTVVYRGRKHERGHCYALHYNGACIMTASTRKQVPRLIELVQSLIEDGSL